MALTGDISRDFDLVRQADAGYFPQRRIRFLGCHRFDDSTDAPLLRRTFAAEGASLVIGIKGVLQRRGFAFALLVPASLPHKLINGWHTNLRNKDLFSGKQTGVLALQDARVYFFGQRAILVVRTLSLPLAQFGIHIASFYEVVAVM
jgi:hypothetical protein